MVRVTVQKILQEGWDVYQQSHPLPAHVRKAARSLQLCRTSALGGHKQGCPDGHFSRYWYNSCKHRLCPQCSHIQIERWLVKQKSRLLACDHHHVIFTIPHQLNELWLCNVPVMTNLLFKCVRDTLFDFLKDPKYLGGTPGIIATLHTWSQTLLLHPHIHCLVTGGGINQDGTWVNSLERRSHFLPTIAVMHRFRGKLLNHIDKAINKEKVTLPENMSYQQWLNLRNKLGRKVKWNVNLRERYSHGEGVLQYQARYIRGGAISNKRLVGFGKNGVRMKYRINGKNGECNKRGYMDLPVEQFIQRYFLHVPEPGTKVVRHYGIYSPVKKQDLDLCRSQLGQDTISEVVFLTWQEYCKKAGEMHPEQCPVCGKTLILLKVVPKILQYKAEVEHQNLQEAA